MKEPKDTCHQQTFRTLYEQHSDALRNFIYYKTGDTGFSEDTVQESYLRLWRKCAAVPFEKAKSFLFTVANNLLLDKVKHEKVQLKFLAIKSSGVSREDPAYLLEEQEFKQKLERAIAALPAGQRTVFLMNRIDKMKYREIAEALGISQKAVEKRMHKALQLLRKQIGNI